MSRYGVVVVGYKNEVGKEEVVNDDICPSCGGKLVKREGKYGEFFGCSNYPKCRFTKK